MKIAATNFPPTRPQAGGVQVATPSQRFAGLVGQPDDPRQGLRDEAYGFAELGVFGAGCAAPAPSCEQRSAAPAEPSSPHLADDLLNLPTPHDPPVLTATRLTSFHNESATREGGRSQLVSPSRYANLPLSVGVEPSLATPELQPQDEVAARPNARRPAAPSSAQAQPRRLSLILSGEGGAIRVVAASAEVAPDERARLRKAAAELAREFGVTLDHFTLNGEAVEADAFFSIGAPHGDRTR